MANAHKRTAANGLGLVGVSGSQLQADMKQGPALHSSKQDENIQAAMHQGGQGKHRASERLSAAMNQG